MGHNGAAYMPPHKPPGANAHPNRHHHQPVHPHATCRVSGAINAPKCANPWQQHRHTTIGSPPCFLITDNGSRYVWDPSTPDQRADLAVHLAATTPIGPTSHGTPIWILDNNRNHTRSLALRDQHTTATVDPVSALKLVQWQLKPSEGAAVLPGQSYRLNAEARQAAARLRALSTTSANGRIRDGEVPTDLLLFLYHIGAPNPSAAAVSIISAQARGSAAAALEYDTTVRQHLFQAGAIIKSLVGAPTPTATEYHACSACTLITTACYSNAPESNPVRPAAGTPPRHATRDAAPQLGGRPYRGADHPTGAPPAA